MLLCRCLFHSSSFSFFFFFPFVSRLKMKPHQSKSNRIFHQTRNAVKWQTLVDYCHLHRCRCRCQMHFLWSESSKWNLLFRNSFSFTLNFELHNIKWFRSNTEQKFISPYPTHVACILHFLMCLHFTSKPIHCGFCFQKNE